MEPPLNAPIDISVKGFFNQSITFKSGDIATSNFKVYNFVQAFFMDATKMIDYKAANGKVYHLNRKEIETYLGSHFSGDNNVANLLLDQVKDAKLAEKQRLEEIERKKKEAEDIKNINEANKGYRKVLDDLTLPQPPQADPVEVASYRSYGVKEGDVNYQMTDEERRQKEQMEKLNREYAETKGETEYKVKEPEVRGSPKRHEPNNEFEGPKSSSPKGPKPKRH